MARESNFRNMFLCLLVICFGGSALLGGVYLITYQPILAAQAARVNQALGGVLPQFDNMPAEEAYQVEVNGKKMTVYPGTLNRELTGVAVEATTNKGFGGQIIVMVGFLPDGTINNTAVISHTETPGLGDKIDPRKSDFSLQFNQKNPESFRLAVKKDGGQVDAITAATISSRAFCDVVDLAYQAFRQSIQKEGGIQ
ncbi:MAG TPA: RnfABCDGE type electron transport complex subunit G [Bacteroidales bacterium]|nr:MAG: Electron transport complex protein RnfG [Bacteroidetes bacterium ADurb.Bin139]HOG25046.1 RnfABCDGE type electron transport complex subunit G [Bacteroidales bacterium]HOR12110.1 RnfABCDGE type electron transport complex subunit G [Bacteroidales bacterium]HOZ19178.1 RnfABCDGE type electron transport complex subunit G [Bacteroidales bacterium]HPB77811.1 RnfABCDGE type electron transport complex subunit G [Bacteroidales bacterium]